MTRRTLFGRIGGALAAARLAPKVTAAPAPKAVLENSTFSDAHTITLEGKLLHVDPPMQMSESCEVTFVEVTAYDSPNGFREFLPVVEGVERRQCGF